MSPMTLICYPTYESPECWSLESALSRGNSKCRGKTEKNRGEEMTKYPPNLEFSHILQSLIDSNDSMYCVGKVRV